MVSGYEPAVAEHSVVNAPENFFTPSRFPGEPPLLFVLPAARLVALRTAPRPAIITAFYEGFVSESGEVTHRMKTGCGQEQWPRQRRKRWACLFLRCV